MFLLIVALVIVVAAYFLPDRQPFNDIIAVVGVICAIISLVLIATGKVVVF